MDAINSITNDSKDIYNGKKYFCQTKKVYFLFYSSKKKTSMVSTNKLSRYYKILTVFNIDDNSFFLEQHISMIYKI